MSDDDFLGNDLLSDLPKSSGLSAGHDLDIIRNVPVRVSAVLGKVRVQVRDLLKLKSGSVVELDRKVGEAIDIYVNERLVARGEVVVNENRLAISITEIIRVE